ncbi:MAG: DUF418 domain-containing protein [Erythrobacter sp.]|jgi:uncharacterized protein
MDDPLRQQPRIVELDALRGLAVIGIAWMNVYVYALPQQAYYNPAAYGAESGLDYAVWAGSFVFIENKFRTIFALLFGTGIAIMWGRDGGWSGHLARMAVLFAIGIVHATLLASNDILRVYALAGLVLPLFLRLDWNGLVLAAVAAMALHLLGGYVWLSRQPEAFFALNYGADPAGLANALAIGREDIGARIARRIGLLPGSLVTVAAAIPANLTAMLAGVALWRSGASPALWSRHRARALVIVCLLIGWPTVALVALSTCLLGFDPAGVARNALLVSVPFSMLMGFAYAVGALALFGSHAGSRWVRLLASVGRLSLTNYLMTSVIFAALFADWGLGLFAQLPRSQVFALSFIPGLAMLAWSAQWLRHFDKGPAETAWRWMAKALARDRRDG